MGEKSFYRRILFSPIFWGLLLGGGYLACLWLLGNTAKNWQLLFGDFLLSVLFWLLWMFFFAQFILPVRTNSDRWKIFTRLFTRSFLRNSGAALFIRDGMLIEKDNESKRTGTGVIVLDTASAVVLKKFSNYTKTAGPGVVFTEKGEVIAEKPVDLYTQIDNAGPAGEEQPFAPEEDALSPEAYREIQKRRLETSALTRDAIEVVPNINIVFKIDAVPAKGNEAGSRFGYNEEAVKKAIWHTSINSSNNIPSNWNQIPISVAVELWREYLGKYRFDELFKESQEIPPKEINSAPETSQPQAAKEIPVGNEYRMRGILCDLLKTLNFSLQEKINSVEIRISPPMQEEEKMIETPMISSSTKVVTDRETALQSIHRLINQRLKEPYYLATDRYGRLERDKNGIPTNRKLESPEYKFLTEERGIRVLSVSIKNLRFNPELEKELIESWSTTWLQNAKDEEKFIEEQHKIKKTQGQEKALLEYAQALSDEILRKEPKNAHEALKTLLQRTRKEIIRNPQLHEKAENEIEQLTNFIQWIDKGSPDE